MAQQFSGETQIAILNTKLENIEGKLGDVIKKLDAMSTTYVTKLEYELFKGSEFATVKRLVYGAVGVILVSFLSGVTYVVFK